MTKTDMTTEWASLTANGKVIGEELFNGTGAAPNDGLLAAIDRRVDTTSREINTHEIVSGDVSPSGYEYSLLTNDRGYKLIVLGIKLFVNPADGSLPVSTLDSTELKFVARGGDISGDLDLTEDIQTNDLKWATTESPNFDTGTPSDERLCLFIPLNITLEENEVLVLSTADEATHIFEAVAVSFEMYIIG